RIAEDAARQLEQSQAEIQYQPDQGRPRGLAVQLLGRGRDIQRRSPLSGKPTELIPWERAALGKGCSVRRATASAKREAAWSLSPLRGGATGLRVSRSLRLSSRSTLLPALRGPTEYHP